MDRPLSQKVLPASGWPDQSGGSRGGLQVGDEVARLRVVLIAICPEHLTSVEPRRREQPTRDLRVVHAVADLRTGDDFHLRGPLPERYANVSWALVVENVAPGRSRLYSRDRADHRGDGLATALSYGPAILEPVSFVMDTKMLRGTRLRVGARCNEERDRRGSP